MNYFCMCYMLIIQILQQHFLFLFLFYSGGTRNEAAGDNGEEHESFGGGSEEEAIEQRATGDARKQFPSGDKAGSGPEDEAGQGAGAAATSDRGLVPEPEGSVEGEAAGALVRRA